MTFFGKRVPSGRIEIDDAALTAKSPQVQRRMQRIDENYAELNEVLADLEVKMENDPTLRELDAQLTDEALAAAPKKKRRYKRRSASPNKPR